MIFALDGTPPNQRFPHPRHAETDPDGLIAVGGDLSPERLLRAYRQGIFPWYSKGQPILWWSPNPRTLLYPKEIHIARSLRREMRKQDYQLKLDQAFDQVLLDCAAPRTHEPDTWLLPEMRSAYSELHRLGHAHSIELWSNETLVGGMYGLAIGRAFFGESMFSRVPSASRVVMVYLSWLLQQHDFAFLDCQVFNPHLQRMGAREVARPEFLTQLAQSIDATPSGAIWQSPPISCQQINQLTSAA